MTHSSDEIGRDGVSEWAQAKAWTLCNASPPCKPGHFPSVIDCSLAFARYIEAHEEPPVDPLLIEAAKFAESWAPEMVTPHPPARRERLEIMALAALRRGIELARSEGGSDVKG